MNKPKTVRDIAKELNITPSGVYWRIENNKLDISNSSGKYLISDHEVLTISTAARQLLCTPTTINYWVEDGKLDQKDGYILVNEKFNQVKINQTKS